MKCLLLLRRLFVSAEHPVRKGEGLSGDAASDLGVALPLLVSVSCFLRLFSRVSGGLCLSVTDVFRFRKFIYFFKVFSSQFSL